MRDCVNCSEVKSHFIKKKVKDFSKSASEAYVWKLIIFWGLPIWCSIIIYAGDPVLSTCISTLIGCTLARLCGMWQIALLALRRKRRDFYPMDISHNMPFASSNTELSQPILFTTTELSIVLVFPKWFTHCC